MERLTIQNHHASHEPFISINSHAIGKDSFNMIIDITEKLYWLENYCIGNINAVLLNEEILDKISIKWFPNIDS